jgi:hypothetical protein
MKTIIYLVGYAEDFKAMVKGGWGCGYVMIPEGHIVVEQWKARRKEEGLPPTGGYLQIGDEEITFTEQKTVNGINYTVIGFDTAHSYNRPENDFHYVFAQTLALQAVIDAVLPF